MLLRPQKHQSAHCDKAAEKGETGTRLTEGVADRTDEGAGGDHEQTVGHAVHADEGGALVAGDGVVELLDLMQEVDLQNALHQHHAEDAAPGRRGAHQKGARTAEQGTDGVEPPHGAEPDPASGLGAEDAGDAAQQQGKEQRFGGPAQLNETLLQKHLGQVAGHRDDRTGYDELRGQRAGAQNMQTVLHELDELTGQVVQGLPGPVGLRCRDDGFVHPSAGEGGDALEQGAEQIKACKAEEPLDRAGQRTQRTGQHGDLGTVGGDLKVFVLAVFRLEAVVDKGREGAGEQGTVQRVQRHCEADGKQIRCKRHQQVGGDGQHTAGHKGFFAAQKICHHAAGHFAQQVDDMENTFGQADLPQGEPPCGQQRDPHGVGDPQAGEEVGRINTAKLPLDVER